MTYITSPKYAAAVKDATRTIKRLTGMPHQSANRFVTEGRYDLISGGDTPASEHLGGRMSSLPAGTTWGELLRFVVDDTLRLERPATAESVAVLLAADGLDTRHARGGLLLPHGAFATAGHWSEAYVADQWTPTGLNDACPSPSRVATAIAALLPQAPTEAADAGLEAVEGPDIASPILAVLWERMVNYLAMLQTNHTIRVQFEADGDPYEAGGRHYSADVDLNDGSVRVYPEGDTDVCATGQLDPTEPSPAGWADAITAWVASQKQGAAAEANHVWKLEVGHRHGTKTTLHRTEQGARDSLAGYVASCWHEAQERQRDGRGDVAFPTAPDPDVDGPFASFHEVDANGDAVALYFAIMDDESYAIESAPLGD